MADLQDMKVSVDVLAKVFKLGVSRVRQLSDEGIIKDARVEGERAASFWLIKSIQLYIEHLREKVANRSNVLEAKNEADLAKRELEVRRLETQIALDEGRAHSTEDVRRVWNDVVGSFKVRFHSLPHILADKLVNVPDRDTAADIIRAEVAELCGLLTAYDAEKFYERNMDYLEDEEADMNGEAEVAGAQ